jgi:hypothetical protein
MQNTPNYQLKKPDLNDYVNITDLNDNADTIDTELIRLSDSVGNLPDLNTDEKTALVSSINELLEKIGNTSSLTTEEKSNLVAAVNELEQKFNAHLKERATKEEYGHVKVGNGINVTEGVISVEEMTASNVSTTGGSNVQIEIDNLKSSVNNGKIAIENAIIDKGVQFSKAGDIATFAELVNGIDLIGKPSAGAAYVIIDKTLNSVTKTNFYPPARTNLFRLRLSSNSGGSLRLYYRGTMQDGLYYDSGNPPTKSYFEVQLVDKNGVVKHTIGSHYSSGSGGATYPTKTVDITYNAGDRIEFWGMNAHGTLQYGWARLEQVKVSIAQAPPQVIEGTDNEW